MNKLNKKAGSKYLSIWWILILFIIGIGVVGGVILFYSKEANVKSLEAEILAGRVADCLVKDGSIDKKLLGKDFNIFSECYLSKDILENNFHYLEINVIYDEKPARDIIKIGNEDIKTQCKMEEKGIETRYSSKCSDKKLISIDDYSIEIFAGSNQEKKNEQ